MSDTCRWLIVENAKIFLNDLCDIKHVKILMKIATASKLTMFIN